MSVALDSLINEARKTLKEGTERDRFAAHLRVARHADLPTSERLIYSTQAALTGLRANGFDPEWMSGSEIGPDHPDFDDIRIEIHWAAIYYPLAAPQIVDGFNKICKLSWLQRLEATLPPTEWMAQDRARDEERATAAEQSSNRLKFVGVGLGAVILMLAIARALNGT